MGINPTLASGTTFAVATALPATYDQAGFAALAYTQIRGVRAVGEIGKQWLTIPQNPIGSPRPTQRRVGLAAASVPLELIRIADAGQSILRAAIDVVVSYSYRQTQSDGSLSYFTAAAISRMNGGIASGGIADTKVTLDIDSVVIEV
jgi:hypothetical protein